MPRYDFLCQSCKKQFSKTLTLAEYEEGVVICPNCGSEDVEQSWAAFYTMTSRKSAGAS